VSLKESATMCVVIPTFNESSNIDSLVVSLVAQLENTSVCWHVLFVDDGSTDGTVPMLQSVCNRDHRFKALFFSRNFGKEVALAAGLKHAVGDCVVLMDSDLQHPPETIHEFIAAWENGYAMVYGQRRDRQNEARSRKLTASAYYWIFRKISGTDLPPGAGDFRLLDRKVVDALNLLPERARFTKGLYNWVGFNSTGVLFDVQQRPDGRSGWNYRQLLSFAIDGVTSFSKFPLRMCTVFGFIISGLAFFYAFVFFVKTLIFGIDVPGFPTIALLVSMLSGVQLLSLGIIGEYVGRVYDEVKGRPLYIVSHKVGFSDNEPAVIETTKE